MLLTAAKNDKNEKNVFILGDIEGAVAYSIYLAVGCKYPMPTSGNHPLMDHDDGSPYWVAWVLYLSGAFLLAFDASRTVCITSRSVSIGYLGGIVSHQYRWDEILFWGTWQSSLQKIQYIYLSVVRPKHRVSFESMKQCHLPYSKELFDLIYLLKNGDLSLPIQPEKMADEELRKKQRTYYVTRLVATDIFALLSMSTMFSESRTFVYVMGFLGIIVFIFYRSASGAFLGKLEAELYNDFIAYQLSQ